MSEWIEWKGGECPVDRKVIVDVRHKDGTYTKGVEAGDAIDDDPRYGFDWWQHSDTAKDNSHGFITAYRVVSE